mmetsp:Transcript_19221/g.55974  ORF Transcript_19221/g.55974 Transcript_19221/m.55974 type:complete len:216 (-) Transcript_19221:121-768(-)
MNSGLTRWTSSAVQPDSPRTRSATSPLVSSPSDSPRNFTTSSPLSSSLSITASTYTVLRHPGTLFSGTMASGEMAGSWLAMKSSCLYLIFSSGMEAKASVMRRSSGVRPRGSAVVASSVAESDKDLDKEDDDDDGRKNGEPRGRIAAAEEVTNDGDPLLVKQRALRGEARAAIATRRARDRRGDVVGLAIIVLPSYATAIFSLCVACWLADLCRG